MIVYLFEHLNTILIRTRNDSYVYLIKSAILIKTSKKVYLEFSYLSQNKRLIALN